MRTLKHHFNWPTWYLDFIHLWAIRGWSIELNSIEPTSDSVKKSFLSTKKNGELFFLWKYQFQINGLENSAVMKYKRKNQIPNYSFFDLALKLTIYNGMSTESARNQKGREMKRVRLSLSMASYVFASAFFSVHIAHSIHFHDWQTNCVRR